MRNVLWIFLLPAVFAASPLSSGLITALSLLKKWSLLGASDYSMPKEFLNTQQLIRREGYDVETHDVTTEDGYILSLTRIVPQSVAPGSRPPVLLVHGLLAASDQWVLRGKHQDLAFLLTDQGFDVWLADLRGNVNGRRHTTFSPGDPRFWEFTFTESGIYDLPAFVDRILNVTGEPRIGYVGHSMGTTIFFVFTSVRPEYNSKVWGSVHLAPIGASYPMERIPTFAMRMIFTRFNFFLDLAVGAKIFEVAPRTPRFVSAAIKLCSVRPLSDFCFDGIGYIVGEHRENFDQCSQLRLYKSLVVRCLQKKKMKTGKKITTAGQSGGPEDMAFTGLTG